MKVANVMNIILKEKLHLHVFKAHVQGKHLHALKAHVERYIPHMRLRRM